MKKLVLAIAAVLLLSPFGASASESATPTQTLLSKLHWRSIGPYIGGRVVAVAGVASEPDVFYFGGVQGGIWRSTDYGTQWVNISDGKIPTAADTIGALAVAPSNPNVIYAGTGEKDIRSDVDTGIGVFKSTDAGKTWHYAGLSDTHTITAFAVDPRNANVVYASSMGHVFKPNAERGVFKTVDGGKTWKKVLYVDADTGAIDVVMDTNHPDVLYAAMWQAQRLPWKLISGGPGSALYKTTDGGAHWTNISKNPGFAHGTLGRMGLSLTANDSGVVYAMVQARDGGVFRSNDGGASWKRENAQMNLRQRAFYYMSIFADPSNWRVAYVPEVDGVFKTADGGVTWKPVTPPGDHHIVWINPHHSNILLEGDDGGAMVSVDGGKSWSSKENQPTGQFYHVSLDDQFPFHVYGAQQDEGAFEGPSATAHGSIAFGDWQSVASGESTFVAPQPGDPDVTYGAAYYSTLMRQDNSTGQVRNVSPWPPYYSGSSPYETRYRFGWTHPILFSPDDPKELLLAAQNVFSSTDYGQTWKVISPDLTRNDRSTEGPSGGPVDLDQTGAETFPDIASLAVSPLNGDLMWAGSADGLVHVTKDHGATWTLVTPPQLPQWAQISSIEPSSVAAGTAYLSASRYMWDDFHPYIFKTTDYGAHWTTINAGLPSDEYVFVVRQDPREPRLLFAGTRSTVFVSMDGGGRWQPLTLNLPGAQMRDIAISARQGEVVVATHGRSFWILDNLALLEQLARQPQPEARDAQLFAPETAWLSHSYGGSSFGGDDNSGANPAYGATVFFNIPAGYDGRTPVTLSFEDASGALVRSFTLHRKNVHAKKISPEARDRMDSMHQSALALDELTAIEPGMNAFQWDMRYAPAAEVTGYHQPTTDDFSASVDGPTIVPGAYTVVLDYGGKKLTAPLTLQIDPRLHPSAADLDARLALEKQVHATLNELDSTIDAAIVRAGQLSPAKRAKLDAAIADLVQLKIDSSEGDVLYETKMRAHLAFLANELEMAYERPTAAEYDTYQLYQSQAAAAIARLRSLM